MLAIMRNTFMDSKSWSSSRSFSGSSFNSSLSRLRKSGEVEVSRIRVGSESWSGSFLSRSWSGDWSKFWSRSYWSRGLFLPTHSVVGIL